MGYELMSCISKFLQNPVPSSMLTKHYFVTHSIRTVPRYPMLLYRYRYCQYLPEYNTDHGLLEYTCTSRYVHVYTCTYSSRYVVVFVNMALATTI